MLLKPEVIHALEREQRMCVIAIERLEERSRPLEEKYGWSTESFLKKFNSGEIGDDQAFFRWFALAEATKDWQRTHDSLNELLGNTEFAHA